MIDPDQQIVMTERAEKREQQRPTMLMAFGIFRTARPVRPAATVHQSALAATALGIRPRLAVGFLPSAGLVTRYLELIGTVVGL